MKKHLLFLVAVLATTMTLNARTVLIDEGFENGIQDDVWTQEFLPANIQPMPWAVEDVADGLSYPSTVVQGTKRAYLRNTTGETLGYTTRLISKVMDLRPRVVYMPELTFYYANPKWGADRDTLRVLYRTGSRAAWKQLAEFSSPSSDWQKVKLSLPEVGQTYQIAFEGKDNLGRGIVLDSIKLQSAPDCVIPYNLRATNKGAGKVNIAWSAGQDADYYELIVTKDTIDPELIAEVETEHPESVVFHGLVDKRNHNLTLEAGEFYLVYVRSLCEDENSAWSSESSEHGPFGFRVRTTKQVPFTETFNYQSGVIRDADWSWGSNTGNTNPYVNTATVGDARAKYSLDVTSALIFSGGTSKQPEVVLPADRYAYIATPALTDTTNINFQVNQLQAHFWSTVYTATGRQYGRSIIVGVMEDPDDITTFVPVDTVSVWGNMTFQENIVSLESYEGNGVYVAFVSDFDRQNLFYIDNLTIEYRPEVNKVTNISVNPRDTYADITWEGNAPSYNLLVTNAEVNPANPAAEAVIAQATVSTNSYRCNNLEADHSWNRPYYVYVQAAGKEWSYRYPFVTIAAKRAIPYQYDFEVMTTEKYQIAATGTKQYAAGIGIFGNSGNYPSVEINSQKAYVGSGYLFLSQVGGKDGWITLPMVENLDSVQVKFYLSGYNTFDQAHVKIGVMSNPMDINTFIPVADFQLNTTGYTRCYANFENYNGPEGVIAIVWADVKNMSKSTINYIDELKVEELSQCVPPTNIDLQIEPDSITMRWESVLSDEWEFFLSRTALTDAQRANKTLEQIQAYPGVVVAQTLTWFDPTTTPQFGFGGLIPHTDYYLYIRATCDMTWWTEMAFNTPCVDESYPYKETFENYNVGSTSAGCWQFADYMGVGYPSIYQAGTTMSSNKALELYSSGTTHRSVAILPVVEGTLQNMLLSFDVRSESSSGAVVYVGTMEDITVSSTFVPFDTVYVNSTSFNKVRFILSNYDLAYDHIAISSGLGTLQMNSDIVIDNVELKDPTCIEAYDFKQTNLAPHSVDVTWEGRTDNDDWQLKLLTNNASIASVKNGSYNRSYDVIPDTVVIGKSAHIAGLQAQSTYYLYVRALCGDSAWTMTPVYTTCELLDPTRANKETFESYAENTIPSCWTVGSTSTTASTIPYVTSHNGSKILYLKQTSCTSWAATPEIDIDSLSSILLTFSTGASLASEYSVFGVMTDPSDLNTFVTLDSVKGEGSSAELQKVTYDLSDYSHLIPAGAKYIAWRGRKKTSDYVYLDDVSIVSMACPMPKPSISELTTSSVRVSSGLRTSDQWILMVTNTPVSDANLENNTIPRTSIVYRDTLTRRSQLVSSLQSQTKYYVYTATLCDSITMSPWNSLSFTTPCQAMTPKAMGTITFDEKDGFVVGSGGEMPCWTTGSKTDNVSASYIPYIEATSSTMHNDNNYLKLYDYVSGTSTQYVGAYAIMPALDVDSISKYQVNFWGRSYNSTSYNNQVIVGVITDPSDLSTFVAIDTLNLSRSTWDPFSVGFETYEGDYMGDLGRNIMFLSDFGMTNYAYISEISVELIPHCRPVSSFSVDSVGENAAIVSWKGYQDSYRMMVADKVLTEEQKPVYHYLLDTIVSHSDNVRLTNLTPTTNYYVYAQGFCGDGERTAISVSYAAFRTSCPTEGGSPLPFYEDFEEYETGAYPTELGCWQLRDYLGSGYPKILNLTSGSQSGNQLELWTTSSGHRCVAIMPLIDADLADCKLSFDTRSWSTSATSTLFIGTMSDIDDETTFEPFDTVYNVSGGEFTHVELILSDYELAHDYLAFSSGMVPMSSDVMLDNVVLEREATCSMPKLKLISTTFDAAELTLIPGQKTDTHWEMVVIPEAEYILIGNITQYLDTVSKIGLDSTHVVLNGLASATSYYVFARTICSKEDISAWIRNPLKISTQFYFEDSYAFGFEKTELWERSTYSVSDNYYLHPALVTGRDTLGEESQSYLYYPYSLETSDDYQYARTNNGALMMEAEGGFYGGYIIFPTVGVAQDRSFEFKARTGYLKKKDSYKPTRSVEAVLEIGTIDKEKTFDTYQPLATLRLSPLDPNVGGSARNNNLLFSNYTLNLDAATIGSKQIVLHMPKQPNDSTYICIDDVALGAPKGYSLAALNKIVADGSSALVEWANIGSPWNLTITDAAGATVAVFEGLTSTSQLVEGLQPQTNYTATLVSVGASAPKYYVTSDKMSFRTLCPAMEPNLNKTDFVWNFDNAYDWEPNDVLGGDVNDSLYLKSECFQVGITYDRPVNGYQWLVQRKGYESAGPMTGYSASRHHEIGRDDSHAMRVYTTEANFNSYLVLPELRCGFDTMMIEFYARCFANYDQSYSTTSARGRIVDATYLGSAYSQSIVVGTLSDPKDLSTLHIIDTLTYAHTELTAADNVNNDPDGLRYWQRMQLPLWDAQGRYIVLFQPAAGLFYLDDLSVKPIGNTLFAPGSTRTSDITPTSATLSWNARHPDLATVVVLLDAEGAEISRTSVNGMSYTLTGLEPAMRYSWYVYQTNGADNSPATKPVVFNTECVVINPTYTCGFEPAEGWKPIVGQTVYTQTLCWTYGDADQGEWKNANYDPYNQANTNINKYSFAGENAVMMRATYSSRASYQPYIAMPAMDITTYDTLQVSFWMRPAYVSAASDSVIQSFTGSTYSKSIIVGTMTDPADASTFVAIDTVTYDGTLSVADKATAANDYLFQQMKVELAGATGPYVAFMTSFYEKGGTTKKSGDYVWLDDIAFEHRQECKAPTDLEALQIATHHADLTWHGIDSAGSYMLQVSTDPYFVEEDAFVFNGTVKSNTFRVEGLEALTTYVWRVQALCGEKWGESSFSQKATFTTSRSPYFLEEFNAVVNNTEWMVSKSHAENIVDGTGVIVRGLDSWSFTRTTKNFGLTGPHYMACGSNNDYHWLITPNFYLPEDDSVHFSMDLALTACNTAHTATSNAVTENDMKDDYYFMIIVSDDGGATWKSENILAKWQNTNPEGKQLRDIPSTGMNVRYSLATYAGKNVRVGLYREARTTSNTGIAIHVDNIRFGYFDKTVDYASACQYEDITVGDIHLSGDDTEPGIHSYPTPYYATDAEAKAGKRDSVFQLEIEIFPAQETFLADTICEGDTYTNYDFQPKSRGGVYRRKLHTVVNGCDSIVTLDLYMKETRRSPDTEVELCPGDTYIWRDKEYNRAGLYRDTTVSSIGCDSVMTLVITNMGVLVDTIYDSVRIELSELPYTYYNAEHPYAYGQLPITYPVGTPKDTYMEVVRVVGDPCADILVLTATIYDRKDAIDMLLDGKGEVRKVVYRDQLFIISNDEWYNALGQKVADPRQ